MLHPRPLLGAVLTAAAFAAAGCGSSSDDDGGAAQAPAPTQAGGQPRPAAAARKAGRAGGHARGARGGQAVHDRPAPVEGRVRAQGRQRVPGGGPDQQERQRGGPQGVRGQERGCRGRGDRQLHAAVRQARRHVDGDAPAPRGHARAGRPVEGHGRPGQGAAQRGRRPAQQRRPAAAADLAGPAAGPAVRRGAGQAVRLHGLRSRRVAAVCARCAPEKTRAMSAQTASETVTTRIPARMDRLPWTAWHWRIIIALGTVWILDGLEVTIVGSISARLQEKETLGLTAYQATAQGSIYVAGACLGAIVFGVLTDRLGRKRLFLWTLSLYLVATIATAFTGSFSTFALCRLFTCMGIGWEV